MEKRFRALRAIATIFKVLAWIVLVAGILFSFLVLAAGLAMPAAQFGQFGMMRGAAGAFIGFAVGLLLTAVHFLMLYAWGEGISLFLAIEENTRQTSLLLGERTTPQ